MRWNGRLLTVNPALFAMAANVVMCRSKSLKVSAIGRQSPAPDRLTLSRAKDIAAPVSVTLEKLRLVNRGNS
jgi:hypothetical protein